MKNSFRLAVVLCYLAVAIILIGASGCPLISQAGVGTTINGKITDENGKPVANASVSTTPTTEIAKTDEAGNYTISEVEAGTYTIKVSKVGYTTKKEEIKISEPTIFSCVVGRTKKIDLILSAELDETGKPKAKTGGIEGTITDAETGKGIQGGTVTTEPATQTITTDTNGKYVIDEVTSGTYTVKVTRDGYIDNSSLGNEVKAGELKTVDIKLTQTSNAGSIKGKVTNSGGTAIEGVTITTNPPTSTKTTDASGNYEITNVSVGDYTITAVKTGYDTGTKTVSVKKGEQATGDVTLVVNNPNQWIQLSPGGTSPTARRGISAVWDIQYNRMLVFGGYYYDGTNHYYNDLWSFNGTSWTQLNPGGTPPSVRAIATAIWDSNNSRMLVFGGADFPDIRKNDLWSFDGTNWIQLTPGGTLPSVRGEHTAIWDSRNNRMLVFGGVSGGVWLNDLWSFDGTNWIQLNPGGTPPSPRRGHIAVWDATNNRMLIFGGSNGSSDLNDLWSYDGTNWIQLNPGGTTPPARSFFGAVWDTMNNRMLIFGDWEYPSHRNDLWSFDGANWIQLNPTGTLPPARAMHNVVWDLQNNRMLIFGGTISGSDSYVDDLWSYK